MVDFDQVVRGFTACNRARNGRHYHHGFAPQQWALGFAPSLPWSLLQSHENLSVQETCLGGPSAFKDRLKMGAAAERAFLMADNDARIRRALLTKARPHRGPFLPGAQVYFYRKQNSFAKGTVERFWQGPATVLAPKGEAVWVEHVGTLVSVAPEMLRFATGEELRANHLIAQEMAVMGKDLATKPQGRSYLGLTGDEETTSIPPEDLKPEGRFQDPPVVSKPDVVVPPPGPPTPSSPIIVDEPVESAFPSGSEDEPSCSAKPKRVVAFGKTEERTYVPESQPSFDALPVLANAADPLAITDSALPDSRSSGSVPFPSPSPTKSQKNPSSENQPTPLTSSHHPEVSVPQAHSGMKREAPVDPESREVKPRVDPSSESTQAEDGSCRDPMEAFISQATSELECFLSRSNLPTQSAVQAYLTEAQRQADKLWSCFTTVKGKVKTTTRKDKSKSKELNWNQLNLELQKQFEEAMKKEWRGWLENRAVKVLSPEESARIPRHLRLRTRFVLTDKNTALRDSSNPLPVLPKAKLIVWVHLDPELPILRTDAPTISELATHLVYQLAASWRTPLGVRPPLLTVTRNERSRVAHRLLCPIRVACPP